MMYTSLSARLNAKRSTPQSVAVSRCMTAVRTNRLLPVYFGRRPIGGRVLGKELLGLYAVTLTIVSIPLDKFLPTAW